MTNDIYFVKTVYEIALAVTLISYLWIHTHLSDLSCTHSYPCTLSTYWPCLIFKTWTSDLHLWEAVSKHPDNESQRNLHESLFPQDVRKDEGNRVLGQILGYKPSLCSCEPMRSSESYVFSLYLDLLSWKLEMNLHQPHRILVKTRRINAPKSFIMYHMTQIECSASVWNYLALASF